jgi:UDP-perosamine 4-acetyltransferase
MRNDILVIGAGGHCRVVLSILSYYKELNVIGIADRDSKNLGEDILGIQVQYTWDDFQAVYDEGVLNAVLAVGSNKERKHLFNELTEIGYSIKTLIDPSALIDKDAKIGIGTTICMGVKIGPLVSIGDNCIIYTGTVIDHETIIKNDCFIAPGVCIAGRVSIENGSFVGIGCSIKEKIKIGANTVIGAGSVVINDFPPNTKAAGVPARQLN